ncbi:MAG: hypothetical protein AAB770_01190 [Patescibacteria group bacterium]
MANLFGWIVFSLVVAGNANATVPVKDCNVGVSPWHKGREVDLAKEREYRLDTPLLLESLGKGDKSSGVCRLLPEVSTIVIPIGFDTSIDHPGLPVRELPWIKKCGNPIVSKFRFKTAKPPEKKVVLVEQKPILDGVDPDYGRTKVEFIPLPEKEAPPRERRTRIVVMQSHEPHYYGGYGGYSQQYYAPSPVYYGSPPFIPSPPVIVSPPGVITGPPGPGVITGPPGPGVITR